MQINFFDFPIRGIDVSAYDLKLLPEKLSEKVHFVICRIGHGTKTDTKFKNFWSSLKGKVFRLTYFYLDYYSNHLPDEKVFGIEDYEWGVIQGKNAWENLKDDNDYPIVYLDIENGNRNYAPEIDTVWNRVELMCDGFFDTYDKLSGITNGIYCSLSKLKQFSTRFRNRPLYLAWYNEDQTRESVIKAVRERGWIGPIHFWQYSSDGDAGTDGIGDGIDFGLGRKVMDLDAWMGSEEEWTKFSKKETDGGEMSVYPMLKHPLKGDFRISQLFGMNPSDYPTSLGHNGIDWATPVGTPVYSMQDGMVIRAADFSQPGITDGKVGYGRHVRIQHPQGVSIYGHFSRLDVKEGDVVKAGDQLGLSGGATSDPNSGFSTGPHLHAEYRMDGIKNLVPGGYAYNAIDILKYIEVEPVEESGAVLYRVKVKIDNLLIRSGAGSNYPVVERYAKGEYDVYEEKNGYGRIGAGRWISLDAAYVTKVDERVPDPGVFFTDAEKLAILWQWYKEQV